YGVEASAQATFGDFQGSAGVGLQKSELGTFYSQDPRLPVSGPCDLNKGPVSATCKNLAGNSQTYAPNFTFNTALQYNFHINGGDLL
ncbi:hypothetical protein, partial [Capnocytophaga ochracea]|uniref:hypothetical protein n=1 Tax=Capnocytophaga ochracea TaxID=1018 RepID=UPI002B474F2C